jgi:hypothetical protein
MEAISKGHSAVEDGAVRYAVSAALLSHTAGDRQPEISEADRRHPAQRVISAPRRPRRGRWDPDPPSGLTIQKSPPRETNVSLQAESRSLGCLRARTNNGRQNAQPHNP